MMGVTDRAQPGVPSFRPDCASSSVRVGELPRPQPLWGLVIGGGATGTAALYDLVWRELSGEHRSRRA